MWRDVQGEAGGPSNRRRSILAAMQLGRSPQCKPMSIQPTKPSKAPTRAADWQQYQPTPAIESAGAIPPAFWKTLRSVVIFAMILASVFILFYILVSLKGTSDPGGAGSGHFNMPSISWSNTSH